MLFPVDLFDHVSLYGKVTSCRAQTVKFGLRGDPRAKISGMLCVCAKFFEKPVSAQIFQPFCCVTRAVFKKRLPDFASVQNGAVSMQSLWLYSSSGWLHEARTRTMQETVTGLVE